MKRINYKSDFDFLLRLKSSNGEDIGWPEFDWEARFWTVTKASPFIVSCIGGVCKNCYEDNGQIHVVMDSHGLGCGTLQVEFFMYQAEGSYPDAEKRTVFVLPLDIELVRTLCSCPTDAETELVLPFVYRSAYDLAKSEGYDGTPEEYAEFVNNVPDVVKTSQSVMRMISDFDEGKAAIADALSLQGIETDRADSMESMAEKIRDLKLAVPSMPGVVDATLNGTVDAFDLLNVCYNNQRAGYYMTAQSTPLWEFALRGADAYLCSDGYFTEESEENHVISEPKGLNWVIYYFKRSDYTVPFNMRPINECLVFSGNPILQLSVDIEIYSLRVYSQDFHPETSDQFRIVNNYIYAIALYNQYLNGYPYFFIQSTSLQSIDTPELRYTYSLMLSCRKLARVALPELETLQNSIAADSAVQSIYAPKLKKVIMTGETGVAASCGALNYIYMPSLETYEATTTGGKFMRECGAITDITLPKLRSISGSSFIYNCLKIESINLPNLESTTHSIAEYYPGGTNLKSVRLPALKSLKGVNLLTRANALEYIQLDSLEELIDASICAVCGTLDMEIYLPSMKYCNSTPGLQGHPARWRFGAVDGAYIRLYKYGETNYSEGITSILVDPGFRGSIIVNTVPDLTPESLSELITNLADNNGYDTLPLTLGATNIAKLSDEDIAVATAKNYTVS